jgi:hypothetical protein
MDTSHSSAQTGNYAFYVFYAWWIHFPQLGNTILELGHVHSVVPMSQVAAFFACLALPGLWASL